MYESGKWEAGIIDILTPYNLRKQAEHVIVGGVKGRKVNFRYLGPSLLTATTIL